MGMFPGDARYRPRSIVTAVVLIAIGLSCVWLSEARRRHGLVAYRPCRGPAGSDSRRASTLAPARRIRRDAFLCPLAFRPDPTRHVPRYGLLWSCPYPTVLRASHLARACQRSPIPVTRPCSPASISIEADGEVIALVGRSGAGKTTLLRLVNRLALPDAGVVLVDGRDTREWDPIALRRSIGYVIQDVGLFPHMTVAEQIGVRAAARALGSRRASRARRGAARARRPAAPSTAERWPEELSGGQRQRVGVARALAADPAVLLMDEPFGALDPVTRAELQREFRASRQRVRKTVIIVTHDMREALALADRVGVLDEGALIACEPPATIVGSARSADVRRLLDAVLPRHPQEPD